MYSKLTLMIQSGELARLRLILLLDALLCGLYGSFIVAASWVAGNELAKRDGIQPEFMTWFGLGLGGVLLTKALASWRARQHGRGWLGLSLLIGLPLWLLPLLLGLTLLILPLLDGGETLASFWTVPGIYLGLFCFFGPAMVLPIEFYQDWRTLAKSKGSDSIDF